MNNKFGALIPDSFYKIYFFALVCLITFSRLGFAYALPENDSDLLSQAVYEVYQADLNEVKISPITEGRSGDRLYKVVKGAKASIVKVHDVRKSVEKKKQETLGAQSAFDLGIGPQVQYVSKTFDLVVTAFAAGMHPDTSTFDDPALIIELASNLKKLHNGPNFILPWDFFHEVRALAPKAPSSQIQLALRQLDKIEQIMKKAGFPKKPCHNDMNPDNLLIDGKNIALIDWGNSGMSDPYYDLAQASLLFTFDATQDEIFLSSHFGDITALSQSRLYLMKQVYLLRLAFWMASQNDVPTIDKVQILHKLFKIQKYALPENAKEKVIRWQDFSKHVLVVFLRNSESLEFKKALKTIQSLKS